MAAGPEQLVSFLRRLSAGLDRDRASDASLLERFLANRDETAFAALVSRHGPMVLAVCQRVLGHVEDAEDAFQATFVVLARRAGSVRPRESLAAWLHGVARRAALKARTARARRLRAATAGRDATAAPTEIDPLEEVSAREVLRLIDQEVQRLPTRYRLPIILCCLEGRSREDAAQQLGWTVDAVKGRLERGRKLLHGRLTRRGLTLSAAMLILEGTCNLSAAAVPFRLSTATVKAACMGSTACAPVQALAQAILNGALLATVQRGVVLLAFVGLVAAGASSMMRQAAKTPDECPAQTAENGQRVPQAPAPASRRVDVLGDPLPPGALARLGTTRLRHECFAFAFSPDGKQLASAGRDALVRFGT